MLHGDDCFVAVISVVVCLAFIFEHTDQAFGRTAPPYLAETLRQSTDVDARRRLQSAATSSLINETRHTWRPRLPGSGCTRLERLAVFYPGCVIIAAILPRTEDSALFIVISHSRLNAETVLAFSFPLLSASATVIL